MKQTVYVTVREFLENGGFLKAGRPLFSVSGSCLDTAEFVELQKREGEDDLVVVKVSNRTYPMLQDLVRVQIEAVPVYV